MLAGCSDKEAPKDETAKLAEAATSGDPEAMYLLGQHYCCGLTPGKSDEKALAWWCQAAREGHSEAQFELGRLYQVEDLPMMARSRYEFFRVKKNNVTALAWYSVAAKNGHALAKNYQAMLNRVLTEVEREQAFQLLKDPRAIPCQYQGQSL